MTALSTEAKEEVKVKEEKKEEVISLVIPPHEKKSRVVTNEDIDKVASDAVFLHAICSEKLGIYLGAYAMHHSQINDTDPLNFWVTVDRAIIINPVITNHTKVYVDSKEGCMSFRDKEQIIVQRWNKIEVEFQTIMVDPEDKDKFKLSSVIKESLSGKDAFIFQHESDHGEGRFIYKLE